MGSKAESRKLKAEIEAGSETETLKDYCERTGSGLRQLAKARVLGLGFGCGAERFVEVAKVMAGLDISEEDSERIVKDYRDSNPKVITLWRRLNDACASCDGGHYVLPLPCTQSNPELKRYLIYRDCDARVRRAAGGELDAGDRTRRTGFGVAEVRGCGICPGSERA